MTHNTAMNIIPFPQRPEYSLELLEQTCLDYLADTKSPLVPIETLLEFVRRTVDLAAVSQLNLLEFLRNHDEVEVLEGPAPGTPISGEILQAAGLLMGPRVLLKRRMPNQRELYAHMAVQLQTMRDTLGAAHAQAAPGTPLAARREALEEAIGRVDTLLQRLAALVG